MHGHCTCRGLGLHRTLHDHDNTLDFLLYRYEQGLVEALRLAAEPQYGRKVPIALKFIAANMLRVISAINHVRNSFHPHLRVICSDYFVKTA
jgi:hypothetical protein